jgi:DNA-directed RNA polymerase specialized sigma subunit
MPARKQPESFLEEEFHAPYHVWKADPSPRNASALLQAVDPVISSALRTYGGTSPSPVLRSHAKLLVLDAAGRYDPSRAKLRTHLMTNLQGLRRVHARQTQIIGVPERVGLDLHRLHLAERDLSDKLGRDPSDAELAEHTGLSMKRLGHVRQARPGYAEGQIAARGPEGEPAFDPAVVGADDEAWVRFVHHDLHPADQLILEHTLGLNNKRKLSKQQIAKKLRLSPGAISQRAAKIQQLLDKREELASFF